jgi:crotonobetainyl-CoA:carnitine CoA-transferase CaiB-like acyl-CoA transferase
VRRLLRDDGAQIAQVANPVGLSRTPVSYRQAPPRLGADGEAIRAWLEEDR